MDETENIASALLGASAVRRAGEKLGIKPKKEGMSEGWYWQLPKEVDQKTLLANQMLQIGERSEDGEDIPFM